MIRYVNCINSTPSLLGNNYLYVTGSFTTAGGVAAYNIARGKTDNTGWNGLGSAVTNPGSILAICADSKGNIYTGYYFSGVGGIGKWNGLTWTQMGASGVALSFIGICVDHNDDVYITGNFTTIGSNTVNYVAKWDGSNWVGLGAGLNGQGYDICSDVNNNIYVIGNFTTAGGVTANRAAKWNGSGWSALASLTSVQQGARLCLASDGAVYVAGTVVYGSGRGCLKWTPSNPGYWYQVGTQGLAVSTNAAICLDSAGNIYLGSISAINSVTCYSIAKYTASTSTWAQMGTGLKNSSGNATKVSGLCLDSNDTLYATGLFVTGSGIAKWNGSSWVAMGSLYRASAVEGECICFVP